jgi:hypothetical protein
MDVWRISRDKRPKKRLILFTFISRGSLTVTSIVLALIFAATDQLMRNAMPATLIVGALAGGAMQYKGKMGWVVNRLIQDILWPQGRLHFDPNGRILLGAIWGALGAGLTVAFFILHFHHRLSDWPWISAVGSQSYVWLVGGGVCGTAIFVFRKIIMARKAQAIKKRDIADYL